MNGAPLPDPPFVAIVDADMGNPGSCLNMLRKIGVNAILTADKKAIRQASRLILPGVGAFDEGMRNLRRLGLIECLEDAAFKRRIPVLGICLGMQLLGEGSDEGVECGLGWLPFRCRGFAATVDPALHLKTPHMGWNTISVRRDDPLLAGCDAATRFYFVHSFYCPAEADDLALTTTAYGIEFASIVRRGNIAGTQFHPEKSHRFGMRLLANFVGQEL